MSDLEEDIGKILTKIDNPEIEKQLAPVTFSSQSELLRNSTFKFIQDQMKTIENYKSVIDNALNSLNDRILHNELDAKDTLSVISSLTGHVTSKTAVILEPFKAAPQSSSPLLSPPKNEDDSSFQKGLSEMSTQDLQLLDSFIRKIAAMKEVQDGSERKV
jgi:hypothetical protein